MILFSDPNLWFFGEAGVKCFFLLSCFELRGPPWRPSVRWAWSSIFHGLITGSLHDLDKKHRRWCYAWLGVRLWSHRRLAWLAVCRVWALCDVILQLQQILLKCWWLYHEHHFLFWLHFFYLCRDNIWGYLLTARLCSQTDEWQNNNCTQRRKTCWVERYVSGYNVKLSLSYEARPLVERNEHLTRRYASVEVLVRCSNSVFLKS